MRQRVRRGWGVVLVLSLAAAAARADEPGTRDRVSPASAQPSATASAQPIGTASGSASAAPVSTAVPAWTPSTTEIPWYRPAASLRGGTLVLTYAMALATLTAAGVAIGAEIDRADLRSGLDPSACNAMNAWRPERCAALHERDEQRNTAIDTTIVTGIGTLGLAGLLAIAVVLERDPSRIGAREPRRPSLAVTAGEKGGGFILSGAW